MKTQLTKTLLTLHFVFFCALNFAQQGIVSGILKDNSGIPIPGANIVIKASNKGVSTDFDGKYSIVCNVGDILLFNYIGYSTREVTVTKAMFGESSNSITIEKKAVTLIKSNAYKAALQDFKKSAFLIPSVADSEKTYNRKSHFQHNRIKHIDIKKQKVKLSYFDPDIYFEVGFKTINSYKFAKKSNLPQLQNTYSQGVSNNGDFVVQGPETGNIFSYGPKINTLEYNNTNYPFDTNGALVNAGNGNGSMAKPYTNSVLTPSMNSTHNLYFTINSDESSFRFDITHRKLKDLYNIERNTFNNIILKYENKSNIDKNTWSAFVKFDNQNNNQPNLNGFQNNLLLNTWVTPASFSNNQGDKLEDNSQRSFSPNNFNNPNWLLNNNSNSEQFRDFISSIKSKFKISEENTITAQANYSNFKNTQNFGAVRNTNGFENGYLSHRRVEHNNFNAATNFDFNKELNNSDLKFNVTANYFYEDLKYNLFQAENFDVFSFENPQTNTSNKKHLHRTIFKLQNKLSFNLNYDELIINLINNSYVSSIQNNKWFLPTLQLKWNLDKIIDIYDFYDITLSASTAYDINDANLLYGNLSHNSLNLNPEESLKYRAINDLFIDKTLKLEEKESYELSFSFGFRAFEANFNFGFTHFTSTTKNTVFPIFENNTFQLKNVASVKNKGVEISLGTYAYFSGNFRYQPSLTFSTYRPKVTKLLNNRNNVPIAGFSTTSKNLIVGQPTGVIMGSAYSRDANNNMIIGNDGFPLINPESQIIGNPIPKFNLGFNNHISLHGFTLDVLVDFQKGGDVWNGTQNTLNYFGASQQSAIERNISNYVFAGVNAQGNTNTIPVDFYNRNNDISENRFVRYGFEGVAESAIEDGSYINIKSIDLNYAFKNNANNEFIRAFEVGIYANNLITWTKFRGASPYSNLFDNTSARGLNFFNAPIISEVGLKINLKI